MGLDKRPRQWWIIFGGDPSDDKEQYKRYVSGEGPMKTVGHDEECIHVVEYSAYESLQEQVRVLEECVLFYAKATPLKSRARNTLERLEELRGGK